MHYIMKNTPCGVYKSSWLRKSLNIMRCVILFILLGTLQSFANLKLFTVGEIVIEYGKYDRTGGSHYY